MLKSPLIVTLFAGAVILWLLTACTALPPMAEMTNGDGMDMAATDEPMAMGMSADNGMEMPEDLDISTTRTSEFGLFNVSYTPDIEPIPLNEMHSWILHMETADGAPVEDATITVDGGMPQHDHGLPTAPAVTENLGGGDYRVEGVKFQMGGWWEVKFNIADGEDQDEITFNLMLK